MLPGQKTIIVLIGFLFIYYNGNSQKGYSVFPKTNYQIILPDSSFAINYDSTGFFSEKYRSKIELNLPEENGVNNYDYNFFVQMILLESSRPGNTILLNNVLDSNRRILKSRVDFDITDLHPAEKGVSNILWIYLYNDNGTPVVLSAEYRLQNDITLGDLFLRSLQTFSKRTLNQ